MVQVCLNKVFWFGNMVPWCCYMVLGVGKVHRFKKVFYESDFPKSKLKTLLLNYITSLAMACIVKEPAFVWFMI